MLAGTIWPGEGPPSRNGAGDLDTALIGSGKDRREHAYAVDSLAASLRPLVHDLDVPSAPRVLTLPNVSHLASDVRGHLDPARPVSLLQLLGAVHPTAAVGGTPTRHRRRADLRDRGHGPRPLRRAGRLARRLRRRRARHRAALRRSWTARRRGCSPAAGSSPTPTRTSRCARPRRRCAPCGTPWRAETGRVAGPAGSATRAPDNAASAAESSAAASASCASRRPERAARTSTIRSPGAGPRDQVVRLAGGPRVPDARRGGQGPQVGAGRRAEDPLERAARAPGRPVRAGGRCRRRRR